MAIDEVLATWVVPQERVPIFRVYGWQPYAISLGYGQNPNELDLQKCEQDEIDVVRRPTGGRAVFHAEEITYSVIFPKQSQFYSPDILSMYNLISQGLLAGLRLLGIQVELIKRNRNSQKSSSYKNNIPCFSFSADYEIVYQNRKLVGSAQRRYENSVLQHGSILTGTRHLNLSDYISFSDESARVHFKNELASKTISISQILNHQPNLNKLIKNLKLGMQQNFNINFITKQLTPQEINEVHKKSKTYLKPGGNGYEN